MDRELRQLRRTALERRRVALGELAQKDPAGSVIRREVVAHEHQPVVIVQMDERGADQQIPREIERLPREARHELVRCRSRTAAEVVDGEHDACVLVKALQRCAVSQLDRRPQDLVTRRDDVERTLEGDRIEAPGNVQKTRDVVCAHGRQHPFEEEHALLGEGERWALARLEPRDPSVISAAREQPALGLHPLLCFRAG